MKALYFLGLMAVVAVDSYGLPPTTGVPYWSTDPNLDCSFARSQTFQISLASGGSGFVCIVSGVFPWLAAGGTWSTSIRVAGPGSGAIGVDYSFYDLGGSKLTLDTTSGPGAAAESGSDVNFVLGTNQPSEVRLLGSPSEAPGYANTRTGSVSARFYCPSAFSCATVLPQLLYSFSPAKPWSLSVPIAWDDVFSVIQPGVRWSQWSAVGINDPAHFIGFVIYNQSSLASIYTVRVYDSNGTQVGIGTTPQIAGISNVTRQGGTLGVVLTDVIKTSLPVGALKVTIDGGSSDSSVVMVQFNPDSATSLQVAFDTTSGTTSLGQPEAARAISSQARLPATVLLK